MEYQFTHESETFLGKLERIWQTNYSLVEKILNSFPKDIPDAMVNLHAIQEEMCNCYVICRDTTACVMEVEDLRRQIGQRLTEARIKHLRAQSELERALKYVQVQIYTEAFERIAGESDV